MIGLWTDDNIDFGRSAADFAAFGLRDAAGHGDHGAGPILAARALGLDTGAMSGFNNAAVDEAFFAGTKVQSNFICTLGYGDKASIFERSPRPAFDRFNSVI